MQNTSEVRIADQSSECKNDNDNSVFDVGLYIQATARINDDLKYHILTEPFKPHETYDFKKDVPEHEAGKRRFRHAWMVQYAPWLAYSSKLKGAVCIYFILFPQKVNRGFQGAFITTAFRKYKDFNECARNHMSSSWQMCSQQDAENFMAVRRNPNKEIVCQLDYSIKRIVEATDRSSFLPFQRFSCVKQMIWRGKEGSKGSKGNMYQLLNFRIEAGDKIIKNHLDTASKNAKYTSHQTEKELIEISEQILVNDIVSAANNYIGFSVLADEIADISGTEQLSIEIRFVYPTKKQTMREEFLGFVPLNNMPAASISDALLSKCLSLGLNLDCLLGQGYDGCSTMARKG